MEAQFWINLCIIVLFLLSYGWMRHLEKGIKRIELDITNLYMKKKE